MPRNAQYFDATALHIVSDEIKASLKQAETALNTYMVDHTNQYDLQESALNMQQIHGVLKLVEVAGAIELSGALAELLQQILTQLPQVNEPCWSAMSEGILFLSHYLEFVLLHNSSLPHFLLPSINKIHELLDKPLIREGYFLLPALSTIQLPDLNDSTTASDLSEAQIQRLISLYRYTLHQLLNRPATDEDVRSLATVAQYAKQMTNGSLAATFWHLTSSAFKQLEQIRLTESRQRILILIEKYLHQLCNPNFSPDSADIADLLCLCTTSNHPDATILRQQLGLNDYIITDAQCDVALHYLQGPDSNTIQTVTQLTQEEINAIKNTIDSLQHGDHLATNLNDIALQIESIAHTLSLLNLPDASKQLMHQADHVKHWQDLSNPAQINALMDSLLFAGNHLTMLNQQYMAETSRLPFHNPQISQHQLYGAMHTIIQESRDLLNTAMQDINNYLEDHDVLHLGNVAEQLESISGVMVFLNAPLGQDILKRTAFYFNSRFQVDQAPPTEREFNLLANIMMSMDHYLEGLALQKPIGIRPFDMGLKSIEQLQAA